MIFLPQILELNEFKKMDREYKKIKDEEEARNTSETNVDNSNKSQEGAKPQYKTIHIHVNTSGHKEEDQNSKIGESTKTPRRKPAPLVIIYDDNRNPDKPLLVGARRINVLRLGWVHYICYYLILLFTTFTALYLMSKVVYDIRMEQIQGHCNVNSTSCGFAPNLGTWATKVSAAIYGSPTPGDANISKKYLFAMKEKMTWSNAENYCKMRDMKLATIDTKESFQHVSQIITNLGEDKKTEHFWLSGLYFGKDGFIWLQRVNKNILQMSLNEPPPDFTQATTSNIQPTSVTNTEKTPANYRDFGNALFLSRLLPKELLAEVFNNFQTTESNEVLPEPIKDFHQGVPLGYMDPEKLIAMRDSGSLLLTDQYDPLETVTELSNFEENNAGPEPVDLIANPEKFSIAPLNPEITVIANLEKTTQGQFNPQQFSPGNDNLDKPLQGHFDPAKQFPNAQCIKMNYLTISGQHCNEPLYFICEKVQ